MPLDCLTLYASFKESIAQLRYRLNSNSKYNITLKAPPVLVCMKNTALGGMSRDKYSTRLRLVLYLSLDTPPRAVFYIQTRGSALTSIYCILRGRIKVLDSAINSIKCEKVVIELW